MTEKQKPNNLPDVAQAPAEEQTVSCAPPPWQQPLLDKTRRQRASVDPRTDPARTLWPYQWHFWSTPAKIRHAGDEIDSPFRQRALYVVHGIGEQRWTQTAAQLRVSVEDAVDAVDPALWETTVASDHWYVPQPFILDGHWANYDDFEENNPKVWERLSPRERAFFSDVWKRRAVQVGGTIRFLVSMGWTLIKKSKGFWSIYYTFVVSLLVLIVILASLRQRTRHFVTAYLNDVRLYLYPRGDVERTIVGQIDRRVGTRFLQMLGLNWDFEELPEKLRIAKRSHSFEEITWVSHSLGTVISYNVIGDLLTRCLELRALPGDAGAERAAKVERGLARFVTLGSPLDKIDFLFGQSEGGVLRPWPAEYLPGGAHDLFARTVTKESASRGVAGSFWWNFHYNADPVAGRLDRFTAADGTSLVVNVHPTGIRLPGVSHVAYWSDAPLVQKLLDLTFAPFVRHVDVEERSPAHQAFSIHVLSVVWLVALVAALMGMVYGIRLLLPF